jgi:type 2 lantibiotic biosynthesis protein LanM
MLDRIGTRHLLQSAIAIAACIVHEGARMSGLSRESLDVWYQALTLRERLASFRSHPHTPIPSPEDPILAAQRADRWRTLGVFATADLFVDRLTLDGLLEAEWLYLLGESNETIRTRMPRPPAWLEDLVHAYTDTVSGETVQLPASLADHPTGPLIDIIAPLIRQGRARLQSGIHTLIRARSQLPFDPATIEALLFAMLPEHLIRTIGRALVVELNIARLRGLLTGDSAEQRFCSFLGYIRQPANAWRILQEYPALGRHVQTQIAQWVAASLEFLEHLCDDWPAIRSTFRAADSTGMLVDVAGNLSDRHRAGRSVLIATFRSGWQLVYKPKPLAIDIHFQQLLAWINDRGVLPPFRLLTILDRGAHGWVEHIASASCTTPAEIQRFYLRQGAYLALLYALEATDIHFENLIAAGEHPVLVDLETLLHPRIPGIDFTQPNQPDYDILVHSVMRTGLLPTYQQEPGSKSGLDISGLGMLPGQLSPTELPYWEGAGGDTMYLARRRMLLNSGQNHPSLDGAPINAVPYRDDIVTGFTAMYQLLMAERDVLLADGGPLTWFSGDSVRVLVRHTRTYQKLLGESFHPHLLRRGLDRDRHFDLLWTDINQRPILARVIAAEQADLHQCDIPVFTSRPNTRDIWSSSGERIADFLPEPSLATVRRRIQRLSSQDCDQQCWVIQAALTTLAIQTDHWAWPHYQLGEAAERVAPERLLQIARQVGQRLATLVLRSDETIGWVGIQPVDIGRWAPCALGVDLYNGLGGIALFLAHLGVLVQAADMTDLARTTLATLQRRVSGEAAQALGIGGFEGWGGILYVLTHLGALWDDPGLWDAAEAIVAWLPEAIDQDRNFDIISGAAGCIGGLLCLYRCRPSPAILATAIHCGDHLLAYAEPAAQGIGWRAGGGAPQALSGFSHGAAGIAWALLKLFAVSGLERFRRAALEAMAFERSMFAPELQNWLDQRDRSRVTPAAAASGPHEDPAHMAMVAWCHGAPGIGMARLQTLPIVDDTLVRAEIATAIETTRTQGFGRSHSLCHGDLGNLDILLQAQQSLGDLHLQQDIARLTAAIVASIDREGWICGVPFGVETPGLMLGIAGIGYQLLRLAAPDRVPSVLTLAPPHPF